MDASESAFQRSRQLTDELKGEVRTMVESWLETGKTQDDPIALVAALGEAAAEVGISFSTRTITVGILLYLAASVNETEIIRESGSQTAHPTPQ